MPVGTQGTVRALSPRDLETVGATVVLANTYHLHVRPGEQVVAKLPLPADALPLPRIDAIPNSP